jgi:chaperonin cofactor prefoldin
MIALVFGATSLIIFAYITLDIEKKSNERHKKLKKTVEDYHIEIRVAERQFNAAMEKFSEKVRVFERNENNQIDRIAVCFREIEKQGVELFGISALKTQFLNYVEHRSGENTATLNQLNQLKKDLEILAVRQHTLEKKIIGAERTINLNIIDQKGKGKTSLLNRAGVETGAAK